MQEAGTAILNNWQTFYVILGTAGATLTGLMFVVITLMAGTRLQVSTAYTAISTFSTPTVVHFCTALLVAAILSAPWHALWNVAVLLGLAALAEAIYVLTSVPQMRRLTEYQPKTHDWLWYFTFPLILYIALAVAALVLPGNPEAALYAIGTVTVALLFIGLRNAWDIVVYLAVERSHPEDPD